MKPTSEISTRRKLERLIDNLVALLNAIDGDPDYEEDSDFEEGGDDEPSLGAKASCDACLGIARRDTLSQVGWAHGSDDDREEEYDGRKPDENNEAWSQQVQTPPVVDTASVIVLFKAPKRTPATSQLTFRG